jgi:hypothetical protein
MCVLYEASVKALFGCEHIQTLDWMAIKGFLNVYEQRFLSNRSLCACLFDHEHVFYEFLCETQTCKQAFHGHAIQIKGLARRTAQKVFVWR